MKIIQSDYWRRLRDGAASARAKFAMLAIFMAITFLIGGASRHDVVSLIVLRPIAVFMGLYALWVMRIGDLAKVRVPLVLLMALVLTVAIQIVPLPPSLWSSLPGRGIVVEVYTAAEIQLPWLPIALSPSRALNTLFSLIVPLTALLLFAVQERDAEHNTLVIIWALAFVSALWGMAQLAGPSSGPLYLYRITNYDLPVGLFANRNHQGLLISIGILISGWFFVRKSASLQTRSLWMSIGAAATLLFLPLLLASGSRSGLLLGLTMLIPGLLLAYAGLQNGRRILNKRVIKVGFSIGLAMIVAVLGAAVFLSRSLALDRLVGGWGESGLRSEVLPSLFALLAKYMPVGSGYGSFEYVYRIIEPNSQLAPAYLNHAHNDWLQFLIEGGLAGVLIMAAFVAWFSKATFTVLRKGIYKANKEKFVSLFIILACGAASITDYPLRVPSMMVVFALACAILSSRRERY